MRALLTAAVVLAVGLGLCSAAWTNAWNCEVYAAPGAPGSNTWTYTVRNTSTASYYSLWVFTIEVDDLCNVSSTVTPSGWSVDTISEPHFITWMYQTGAVPAGEGCAGFSATFTSAPQSQAYTALFNDDLYFTCPYTEGQVTVAATTPEPAGALVLLSGCGPVVAFMLRRRSRR